MTDAKIRFDKYPISSMMILLSFVILVIGKDKMGYQLQVDNALIMWAILFFGTVLSHSIPLAIRYLSPKIFTNSISGTTDGEFIEADKYAIFTVADVHAWFISKKLVHEGAVIFPIKAIKNYGRNITTEVQTSEYEFDTLPKEVRFALFHNRHGLQIPPPYHFGMVTKVQKRFESKYGELEEKMKEVEKRNTFLETKIREAYRTTEDISSSITRLTDAKKQEGLKEIWDEEEKKKKGMI